MSFRLHRRWVGLLIGLGLAGCGLAPGPFPVTPAASPPGPTPSSAPPTASASAAATVSPTLPLPPPPTGTPVWPENLVTEDDASRFFLALQVLHALRASDGPLLARLAAPQGVTFSPDLRLDPTDRTVSPSALATLWEDPTPYLWGVEPDSGEPIRLTFAAYAARYLNDCDYLHAPQIALDRPPEPGNAADNLRQRWPQARFVTFRCPAPPTAQGSGGTALQVVLVPASTREGWRLRGLFHHTWTP